ncbi:MAG: PDZ domain-containing protein, partial [Spirochaetales bacterium]|nr:PDZ domain-containing protein [Spirochaetales bacterium]
MDLHEWKGSFIFNIHGDSPAQRAGLQPGDLVIALNGKAIEESDTFDALISDHAPGETVKVTFVRNGRELTENIELERRDESSLNGAANPLWPGFTVAELKGEMREKMGLSRYGSELIIGRVLSNSRAAAAGLQSGDVIKAVNNSFPRDTKDFYRLLNSGEILELRVERRGYEFEYQLECR